MVPFLGDLSAELRVVELTGGENVAPAQEAGTTCGGSGLASRGWKKLSVNFNEGREIVFPQTSWNALVNGQEGESPMEVLDGSGNLRPPRGTFCCLTFAKSCDSGGSPGSGLAGVDLHPSESFGGVDLGGEDGKAAGEFAKSLRSALAVEDTAETVEAFAGEHGEGNALRHLREQGQTRQDGSGGFEATQ